MPATFGGAPVIQVSGRTFPVEVIYRPLSDADSGDKGRQTDNDPQMEALWQALCDIDSR